MKQLFISLLLSSQVFVAQNSPSSIVLYNSAAEISYTEKITLTSGKNVIVFRGLTPYIIENTLKISSGSKEVEIISVTEKINFLASNESKQKKTNELQKEIARLENQKGFVNCKITALTAEKTLLFKNESIGGLSNGVSVDEIEKASNFFRTRYTDLVTTIYILNDSLSRMGVRITKLKNAVNQSQIRTEKPASEIHLVVNSKTKTTSIFEYSFLTSKAGWAPLYDIKYQGNNSPLLFNFKANVFNATGTSWENIEIRLSTANPINGFSIPSLSDKKTKQNEINSSEGVEFKTLEVVNAIASYDVKHKYTIPSNAKPHLIDVDSYSFDAQFNYLVFPRLDPFGFLMAYIPNWNKHNLIPGTTNIYNEGVYMGKTFLNTYAENDTLEVYLGKDKNIQVKRTEDFKNNLRKIIGNYSIEKYAVKIDLTNNSGNPFNIQVIDQVPIIDNDDKTKMDVDISNGVYNKQEGLITWNLQLQPGAKQTFDFKYEIKEPKEFYGKPKKRAYRTISCPSF